MHVEGRDKVFGPHARHFFNHYTNEQLGGWRGCGDVVGLSINDEKGIGFVRLSRPHFIADDMIPCVEKQSTNVKSHKNHDDASVEEALLKKLDDKNSMIKTLW